MGRSQGRGRGTGAGRSPALEVAVALRRTKGKELVLRHVKGVQVQKRQLFLGIARLDREVGKVAYVVPRPLEVMPVKTMVTCAKAKHQRLVEPVVELTDAPERATKQALQVRGAQRHADRLGQPVHEGDRCSAKRDIAFVVQVKRSRIAGVGRAQDLGVSRKDDVCLAPVQDAGVAQMGEDLKCGDEEDPEDVEVRKLPEDRDLLRERDTGLGTGELDRLVDDEQDETASDSSGANRSLVLHLGRSGREPSGSQHLGAGDGIDLVHRVADHAARSTRRATTPSRKRPRAGRRKQRRRSPECGRGSPQSG